MQMLPVLEYIHGQRVIHRDIKPSNIIRRKENGQFVLIDFELLRKSILKTKRHILFRSAPVATRHQNSLQAAPTLAVIFMPWV